MNKWRIRVSIAELLLLIAWVGILCAFWIHTDREIQRNDTVRDLVLSQDGKFLAEATSSGIGVFDITTGRLNSKMSFRDAGSLAFSSDSQVLASGGMDGSLFVWDVASGKPRWILPGHTAWVRSVKFSPDSKLLYSAGRDNHVRVWDLTTGTCVARMTSAVGEFESMAISPDGLLLATGASAQNSNCHKIEVWNAATYSLKETLVGPEYCYVYQLAFSTDGKRIATGLSVPGTRVWNVSDRQETHYFRDAVGRDLVLFSPAGTELLTSSYEGLQAWDLASTSQNIPSFKDSADVRCAVFSDQSTVITAEDNGTVRFWDWPSQRLAKSIAGLTLNDVTIPWVHLAVFCGWSIAWCLASKKAILSTPAGWKLSPLLPILVAACYVIVSILLLMYRYHGVARAGLLTSAVIVVVAVSKTAREHRVYWLSSLLLLGILWLYEAKLLLDIIASV